MKPFSIKIKLITPLFSYGANNKNNPQPEIRVPSVRGMLRWWANALLSADEVAEILGGEQDKSPVASRVRIRLSLMQQLQKSMINLLPHPCPHPSPKMSVVAGTKFELLFSECLNGKRELDERFIRVLKCWLLLGALGGRSNRGAGSFSFEWDGFSAPEVPDNYIREVNNLLQGSHLHAAILPGEFSTAEEARIVASNTIAGGIGNNALGNINPRVPSPLRFRVVEMRAAEGAVPRKYYALAAIWDGRNRQQEGRSDLMTAIDELSRETSRHDVKAVGELLKASALYQWCNSNQ